MKKKIIIGLLIIFTLILLYCGCALYVYGDYISNRASLVSNLGDTSYKLRLYLQDNQQLPDNVVDLEKELNIVMIDSFTGEYLEYYPENLCKTNPLPLIIQKEYHRTKIWPLGELEKYTIMNKPGIIRPIYKKSYEQ